MSSVLKRLRERSEMREAGIDDRGDYREFKELRERGASRARRAFEVPDTAPHETRSRSKQALELIDQQGITLKSLARAARMMVTGK